MRFIGRINTGEEEQEAGQRPAEPRPYGAGTKTPLHLENKTHYASVLFVIISSYFYLPM